MSSASAKFLSCKIVLLSPTCFVWPAHTSSGSFTIQLGVPTYIYLKTNWSLHWTQSTYGFAYRNRKPRGCTPRKQAKRYFTRCDICNVLGPTVACVAAWRRSGLRSSEAAKFAREARENEPRSREKNKNQLLPAPISSRFLCPRPP